ncbi:MAG: 2-polyprenyl-6-methoxyphenol hydroxylase [Rhodobacteraceae bacterium]|nr:2-polyprenyl-6-methoxyphenol hydroxylase [Paracoccaceae bacterium]
MQETEVLIVGAGPVGLTLAIDLGQQGIRCILIDKKPGPEFLPKMERCNARTMEIFRRMGLTAQIRAAGLAADVPMDVYITKSMVDRPYVHLQYPSINAARAEIAACQDTSLPAEPYQLISQYTLEPLLRAEAERIPNVTVRYGLEFLSLKQDAKGVTARLRSEGGADATLRAAFVVGCDGGASTVRHALGIALRGEGDILRLRQALYRCDGLFARLPIGEGPGPGRHYHITDDRHSFLIMQDSTRHWTLHAVVEDDAAMARQFETVIGAPVDYETLYVGEWKQNLLLADRYADGRVFLAGDAVHLVIPTGGLGMNTGIGDAIDLSWKLAAVLRGWGGPALLRSYELERRQVGDRNIGASRYAATGRRKWRRMWDPAIEGSDARAGALRADFIRAADAEQRKTNEMIGAELGYRYVGSPVIWEEPGGPEQRFRTYDPAAWTGVRMSHAWIGPGQSVLDLPGREYTALSLGDRPEDVEPLTEAIRRRGAPVRTVVLANERLRALYGRNLFLLRPDLHIAWRGNALPHDPDALASTVTGWTTPRPERAGQNAR